MNEPVNRLKCMDVEAWRAFTKQEMRDYFEKVRSKSGEQNSRDALNKSILIVRRQLSPVDMYCYLKARFGEPNGVQNFLRKDDSDNWIHWDFNLKAADEDVYICGTYREVHFLLSEKLEDVEWRDFILKIKSDFGRIGKAKSEILNSLEKWAIFPNKFVEIAEIRGICTRRSPKALRSSPPTSSLLILQRGTGSNTRRLLTNSCSDLGDCIEIAWSYPCSLPS